MKESYVDLKIKLEMKFNFIKNLKKAISKTKNYTRRDQMKVKLKNELKYYGVKYPERCNSTKQTERIKGFYVEM